MGITNMFKNQLNGNTRESEGELSVTLSVILCLLHFELSAAVIREETVLWEKYGSSSLWKEPPCHGVQVSPCAV